MNNEQEVSAIKLTLDDLQMTPPRFSEAGKPATLFGGYFWATFQDDAAKPPIHYLRSFTSDKLRSGGIVRLGETPVSPNTIIYGQELYPIGSQLPCAPVLEDGKVVAYEHKISDGSLAYVFAEGKAHIYEKDVIDWDLEFFPYALCVQETGLFGIPYMQQICKITGTYEGRAVSLYGGFDLLFKKDSHDSTYGKLMYGLIFAGKCPDGRYEWGSVTVFGDKSFGLYCKEGEEPIIANNVYATGLKWEPLTYLDDNTVTYTQATYHIGDVKVHYKAKWGYRGWDEAQVTSLKKHGYSLTSGEFYVGDTPYQHESSFTFAEAHDATENVT